MNDTLSEKERLHNQRAEGLRATFNEEGLAEFLHQTYRAACKALTPGWRKYDGTKVFSETQHHDHGYGNCSNKAYFLKRARYLLAPH